MNLRTPIHSKWLAQLAKEYPQSADQLSALAEHLFTKQEKLAALIRYCAARPELPMMRMYAEYNAALDAMALESQREEVTEVTDEEAVTLDPRARAARTKRIRTYSRIMSATCELLLKRSDWTREEVAEKARVGIATVYKYYNNRDRLLVAAYECLLANK